MAKVVMQDYYICSSLTVPKSEKEKYKGMRIKHNTQFVEFILDKLKKDPSLQGRQEYYIPINFKVKKSHKDKWDELRKILEEKHVGLSELFTIYFDEFKSSEYFVG